MYIVLVVLRATFLIFGKFAQVFPPWFRQRKNERKACKKGKNPKNTEYFIKDIIASPPFSAAKSKKEFSCKGFQKKLTPTFFVLFLIRWSEFSREKSCIIIIPTPEYMNKTYLSIFQVLSNLIVTLQKTHIHTTLYSHNIIIISDDLVIKYFPPRHCETKDVSK